MTIYITASPDSILSYKQEKVCNLNINTTSLIDKPTINSRDNSISERVYMCVFEFRKEPINSNNVT